MKHNIEKNLEFLKINLLLIDKKEDKKGKFILSWKEEEKVKSVERIL